MRRQSILPNPKTSASRRHMHNDVDRHPLSDLRPLMKGMYFQGNKDSDRVESDADVCSKIKSMSFGETRCCSSWTTMYKTAMEAAM